jgi:lipoprotein-releasing system ATP-binding protein
MPNNRQQFAKSSTPAAILRASAIRKTFKTGETDLVILKHVDLTVGHGEFVAIEGRSGSGKSTLLHILGGLDVADSGSVEFENTNVTALAAAAAWESRRIGILRLFLKVPGLSSWLPLLFRSDRALAEVRNTEFGFVFQFYHLLPELNVLENTLLAPMIQHSWLSFHAKKRELRERAIQLLEELGLSHRLKHRPAQLSGGERQRVAIARALMNNPRVLFADEPTGNLDAETGRQIMDVLERLHQEKGQTVLMVTHDRTLAREADRVLLLKDGRLVAAE